jgi:hypothetical protein
MTKEKLLYPISDSGYDFIFNLVEAAKASTAAGVQLKVKYSLTNNHKLRFQIPIDISHSVHLDCMRDEDFGDRKTDVRTYSDRVVDLKKNVMMFGYGDDHHVTFEPGETREFLIMFQPVKADFKTFDIELRIKPDQEECGEYRLRYDFGKHKVTKRFRLGKEPQKNKG